LSIEKRQISELLVNAVNEELYIALICQLNKDFVLANLEYEIDENCTPQLLKLILGEIVAELVNNEFDSFLNLLYRIDLSEHKILELPKENQATHITSVVYLILKREWQKVWFKKNYS